MNLDRDLAADAGLGVRSRSALDALGVIVLASSIGAATQIEVVEGDGSISAPLLVSLMVASIAEGVLANRAWVLLLPVLTAAILAALAPGSHVGHELADVMFGLVELCVLQLVAIAIGLGMGASIRGSKYGFPEAPR
jgi:hypothetical protein